MRLLSYNSSASQVYKDGICELVLSAENILFYRNTIGEVHAVRRNSDPILILEASSARGLAIGNNGTLYACTDEGIAIIPKIFEKLQWGKLLETRIEKTNATHFLKMSPNHKRLVSGNAQELQTWKIAGEEKLIPEHTIESPNLTAIAIESNENIRTLDYMGKHRTLYYDNSGFKFKGSKSSCLHAESRTIFISKTDLGLVFPKEILMCTDSETESFKMPKKITAFAKSSEDYCYIAYEDRSFEVRKIQYRPRSFPLIAQFITEEKITYINADDEDVIHLAGENCLNFLRKPRIPHWDAPISAHAKFIVENYYLIPFPDGTPRENHGALHVCRAAILGVIFANLRQRRNCPLMKDVDARTMKLIQIALLLHDAGRQASGVDHWDLDSATIGYKYIENIGRHAGKDAHFVGDAIANKDSYGERSYIHGDCNPQSHIPDWRWIKVSKKCKRKSQHVLVHDADCGDNKRTKRDWHASFLDYVKEFLAKEDFTVPSLARTDLMCVLDELDQLIFYTGDSVFYFDEKQRDFYNTSPNCYDLLLDLMKEKSLNNLLALYAEGRVLTVEEAQALALTPRSSAHPAFLFKKFISTREEYELSDLLLSFTRSPFNVDRRALRQERDGGQIFSIRAKKEAGILQYDVQRVGTSNAVPMYFSTKKRDFSKATGLGYCDPRFGFSPCVYREDLDDEIGFLFPPEYSLLSKIFAYDGNKSTYYRFYEQDSYYKTQGLLESLQKDEAIFSSLSTLTQNGRNGAGYQVMARLRYGEGIKILLFSCSKEALIKAEIAEALLIARITQWALENRMPAPPAIKIPIIYYLPSHPLFLQEYTRRQHSGHVQSALRNAEKKISPLKSLACSEAHILAAHNDVEGLRTLKNESPTTLEPCDTRGRTPLFYAAQNGHVAAIIFLLLAGANFQHSDSESHSFLFLLFKFHYFSEFKEVMEGLAEKPALQKNLTLFYNSTHGQLPPQLERCESANPKLIDWFYNLYENRI